MLTQCQLCGEDGQEILMLGAKCHKICNEVLGEPYRGASTQRMPHGLCKRCKDALKAGAAAYVCQETREVLALSGECVARCELPGGGRISRVTAEDMKKLQATFNPKQEVVA